MGSPLTASRIMVFSVQKITPSVGFRLTGLLHQQAAVVLPGDGATDNSILGIGDIGSCAGASCSPAAQRGDALHGGTRQEARIFFERFISKSPFCKQG